MSKQIKNHMLCIICMHTHQNISIYICLYICTYTEINIYMYVYAYKYVYGYIHIYTNIHIHTHVYIGIYTYIHTHTHVLTHSYVYRNTDTCYTHRFVSHIQIQAVNVNTQFSASLHARKGGGSRHRHTTRTIPEA